jgi:PelA/Pel-15E family pectate lyase
MKSTLKYRVRLVMFFTVFIVLFSSPLFANKKLQKQCLETMKKATQFMVDEVSTNGGYLWHYLPDFSRQWGEMEAYKTQIWVQPPGTTSMGHLFLDAYHATGDELYWEAAEQAARALIWGQLDCGGWNYIIDYAGDRSLKEWYSTIGKNGWRLEEFQHYYGNATFDDDVSSYAAKFLLRMYLEKFDPAYKYPLDKAIDFILASQYDIGGWPQRYPLKYDFSHHGKPDYTSFYTFNDDVVWENVNFLIQCYQALGEERFLEPIRRGMNFYIITQQAAPQAGWGQQHNMNLEPVGARTYEPDGMMPGYTRAHIGLMLRFYRLTGDRKFLARIPEAIDWLESCKLPENMTEGSKYTHSVFVEIGTNKPIFVHRRGSNVIHGEYYYDYKDDKPVRHYGAKTRVNIDALRKNYERVAAMSVEEATKDSPLLVGRHTAVLPPQAAYSHSFSGIGRNKPGDDAVKKVIEALDSKNRWLSKHSQTSNPYIGDGVKTELTDEYAEGHVGDKTDTSPYSDESEQEYITTRTYINNMRVLMNYVSSLK